MSARSRDFAAGTPHALPVAPDYAISDFNAQLNAQAEAGTDHVGIAKIRAEMLARQAQLQPLLTPAPAPLPDVDEARAGLATARVHLREAIFVREAAETDNTAAINALLEGQKAVDAAQSALQALGDTDGLVAAWRAGRISADKDVDPLPPDLGHRRDESDRLRREIADAERTATLLAQRVKAAGARLDAASVRVDETIAGVLDHEATLLSMSMLEHQRAAFELRRRLTALQSVRLGDRGYRLPAAVSQAIDRDPLPWSSILPAERERPLRDCYAAVERLRTDADAAMESDARQAR